MVETDVNNDGFRNIANGFIRFSIKADDTEENQKVHEAFKEFCKIECDNNYTLGLRKLLEYIEEDAKYASMQMNIESINSRVSDIETKISQPKEEKEKEDGDVF